MQRLQYLRAKGHLPLTRSLDSLKRRVLMEALTQKVTEAVGKRLARRFIKDLSRIDRT